MSSKPSIKIGRDNSNDITINEPRVSRNHAVITDIGNGNFEIKDLGSSNGTFVNGIRITQKNIHEGDKVEVAGSLVNWFAAFANPKIKQQTSIIQEKAFAKILKTISVGSALRNDIVITDNFVSNHHAKISLLKDGNFFIQDLGSSNGTFVNGAKIQSKNFTKTDVVKIATSDLPQNWFEMKSLKRRFLNDNKKTILISLSILVIVTGAALSYFNSCKWFDCGCNLKSGQIYSENKNSILYIEHSYYYTIEVKGKEYFVGKNKDFDVTEANTSKENLKPYGKVTGCGCFISNDGKILTSAFIASPWFNETEKKFMLKEVVDSRTIDDFSIKGKFKVCGETAELKFLLNGLVNNSQNYVAAAATTKECVLNDNSCLTIQSTIRTLPVKASIAEVYFNKKSKEPMHKTQGYYYASTFPLNENMVMKDTFYFAKDSLDINKLSNVPLNRLLPKLPEGSPVFNERGELIGMIQQKQLVFLNRFINQLIK